MTTFATVVASVALLSMTALLAACLWALVTMTRSSWTAIRETLDISAHVKRSQEWNQRTIEVLRGFETRMQSMESSQASISEAILSVPMPVKSQVREQLSKVAEALRQPPQRPTAAETVELLDEKQIAEMNRRTPSGPRSPSDNAIGKPI